MSPSDADRKRQEALAALKARKLGGSAGGTLSFRPASSPPASPVLVPPSSSPAGPSTSKFFGGPSNGFARGPSSALSPTKGIPSSGILPSSGLPRVPHSNGHGANGAKGAGTPGSVISAIQSRRTAPDMPRVGGPSSLSYETRDGTASSATLVGSPESPAPLSRLKKRYDAESPIKNLTSPVCTPGSTTDRTPAPVKRPSLLVKAAKESVKDEEVLKQVNRLALTFCPKVTRQQIMDTVNKYPGDEDRMIHELEGIRRGGGALSPATSFNSSSPFKQGHAPPRPLPKHPSATSSSGLKAGISPAQFYSHTPQTTKRPPTASSSIPIISRPVPVASPPIAASPKPKKNDKSAIYKHRGNGKRKDPDESDSAGEVSDDESEVSWSGDEQRRKKRRRDDDELDAEGEALKAFNEVAEEVLTGTIACSVDQAKKIIALRPYEDEEDVRAKLNKARGVSSKLFEQYVEIMEGYVQIDSCLNKCEAIAQDVSSTLAIWRGASAAQDSVVGTPRSDGLNDVKVDVNKVSEMLKEELDPRRQKILRSYMRTQPAELSEGTVLKDYQLLGVNWLNLLYSKKIGCILADEMGLGKTIQVIAFLLALQDKGLNGPHMIFVPASTLENWTREFERFAPKIDVRTYYGSQAERAEIRDELKRDFRAGKLQVVLASYTQVASHDDLSFFRKKIEFDTCIYDEGHKLKNCTTKAYTDLLSIKPRWRLLLTGTPLQNNLQELVSLLMFIHKNTFADAEPYLRAIFKSQGQLNQLSQQRVSRARTMLTPFVLRRRKAHVLNLPPKTERVEVCTMTTPQRKIYNEAMQRSKKALEDMSDEILEKEAEEDEAADGQTHTVSGGPPKPKGKSKKAAAAAAAEAEKKKVSTSGSHIVMELRKAASHPLLFRKHYTDAKIRSLAKACLNTPTHCDANYDYVVEDLEIMSDAEIHHFCTKSEHSTINAFALKPKVFLEGGKVSALQKIIEQCKKDGKRMLLFSQFTMILDILEVALTHLDIQYTRLDGATRVDERQGLVDEFNDDPDITVFLLSTKAGGVGINLTAASVVVIYDLDFNPHNDRQAADRAYRIGQEKEVEVIKLITEGSIDEDMLAIGTAKLKLDDAVGGDEIALGGDAGSKDDKTAKEMRKSLLTTLRNKFVPEPLPAIKGNPGAEPIKEEDEPADENEGEGKEVKKARGSIVHRETQETETLKAEP